MTAQILVLGAGSNASGGFAARDKLEDALWAYFRAMQACGAPEAISRRALCRSIHVSPSSVKSWTRLGTAATEACMGTSAREGSRRALDDGVMTADTARACVATAIRLATAALRRKSRESTLAVSGHSSGGNSSAPVSPNECRAGDVACSISNLARLELLRRSGQSSRAAIKAATRAVHIDPSQVAAWRCIAMVG